MLHECAVLVVEDDSDVRQLLGTALARSCGCVTVVSNGAEGIRRLAEGSYDIVVCDLQMPFVGGVEVLRVARDSESRPALVAISGFLSRESAETLAELDVEFLAKPFRVSELVAALERSMGRRSRRVHGSRKESLEDDREAELAG